MCPPPRRSARVTVPTLALAGLACLVGPVAAVAPAQETLFEIPPKFFGDQVGHALALSPDVNADGYPELLVSVRGRRIELRSGKGGAPFANFLPPVPLPTFGSSLDSAGDVDADGVPDVIAGAYELSYFPACYEGCIYSTPGRAFVYSGADGSVLHELGEQFPGDAEFGWSVAGLGDADGDGHDDVAVGAPALYFAWNTSPGYVTAFSGVDGSPLWTVEGDAIGAQLGHALARLPDRDGDGVDELAVGAPGAGGGYVALLSGATGSEIMRFGGPGHAGLGAQLSPAGDVDSDGVEDLAAVLRQPTYPPQHALVVFSGADGRVLTFAQPAVQSVTEIWGLGVGLSGGGDVDGDGGLDVLVGCDGIGALGVVRTDGAVVGVVGSLAGGGTSSTSWLLDNHAAVPLLLPDQTGDGRSEIAIGEPRAPGGGRVTVLSGEPGTWTDLGAGLAGGLFDQEPVLSVLGTLESGAAVKLRLRTPLLERVPSSVPARLVIGLKEASLPFHAGVLVPAPDLVFSGTASTWLPVTLADFVVPPDLPPGLTLYLQVVVVPPAAPAKPLLSNAVLGVVP